MFYKNDRLALFIDGVSVSSTVRDLEFQIDYNKVRDEFARRGCLIRMLFYAVDIEAADEYSKIRKLTDFLSYNGYVVKTRSARDVEGGFRRAHEALKMQMAMDILDLAGKVDHVVISIGDASMAPLVEAVQKTGTRVSIMSSRASPEGGHVSDELRRQADNFIEMRDLREVIARDKSAARAA